MSNYKYAFEEYPRLKEIIQYFAAHVPVDLGKWSMLLGEIDNAIISASQPPAAKEAVWVRASVRLPDHRRNVIVSGYLNEQGYTDHRFVSYGHKAGNPAKEEMYFEYGSRSFLTNEVEWLDESPTAAGDGEPEDGPAQQAASAWVFEENGHKWSNNNNEAGDNYGSFIAGWKAAKAATAGDGKEAIEFHDWVEDNAPAIDFREQKTHTTAQLYDIYLTDKNK